MASFTLKELATLTLDYLGLPSADADIASGGVSAAEYTRAKRWANLASQEVADFGLWFFLKEYFQDLALVANDWEIALPSNCHALLGNPYFEDSTIGMLSPVSLQEFSALRVAVQGGGTPQYYTVGYSNAGEAEEHDEASDSGGQLLFIWPAAGSSLTLKISYTASLEDMTKDTHKPPMPPRFHPLILTGTMGYGEAHEERNWEGPARRRFDAKLSEMWTQWASQTTNLPMRIRAHSLSMAGREVGSLPQRPLVVYSS